MLARRTIRFCPETRLKAPGRFKAKQTEQRFSTWSDAYRRSYSRQRRRDVERLAAQLSAVRDFLDTQDRKQEEQFGGNYRGTENSSRIAIECGTSKTRRIRWKNCMESDG